MSKLAAYVFHVMIVCLMHKFKCFSGRTRVSHIIEGLEKRLNSRAKELTRASDELRRSDLDWYCNIS